MVGTPSTVPTSRWPKMIDNSFLTAVKAAYRGSSPYPHTFRQFTRDTAAWERAGKPHCWIRVESKQGVDVFIDTGWGHLAAYYSDKVVGWSAEAKQVISTSMFVVLDREYFGVHKYIWF